MDHHDHRMCLLKARDLGREVGLLGGGGFFFHLRRRDRLAFIQVMRFGVGGLRNGGCGRGRRKKVE
jgi:hypothetical protein